MRRTALVLSGMVLSAAALVIGPGCGGSESALAKCEDICKESQSTCPGQQGFDPKADCAAQCGELETLDCADSWEAVHDECHMVACMSIAIEDCPQIGGFAGCLFESCKTHPELTSCSSGS